VSIQFGRWNLNGQPADPEFMRRVATLTSSYRPDGDTFHVSGSLGMFLQLFATTNDSLRTHQLVTSPLGVTLTWDGRLDNRDELIGLLDLDPKTTPADVEIALASYGHWNTSCFGRLVGDWALAIWDPLEQAVLLAKDLVGTRHLFYSLETKRATWSTVLDPLVLLSERPLQLSEEFIAGYLSTFPATHLTPYVGIFSVPACTFVRIERRRISSQEYWHFDPSHRIAYQADTDYEQHFRQAFSEAVRRRLRTSSPVVAELSGGMDSSSIVCVADQLLADQNPEAPRLDTLSCYDDDEPNWDERPYFSLVEQKRGRTGYRINVGDTDGSLVPPDRDIFLPVPGYDQLVLSREREVNRCLAASQSRVLLSGIGGDEFLGGVPTPIPELQDLFSCLQWLGFARRLWQFSLQQRRPWTHLCFDSLEEFLPQPVRRLYKTPPIPPWLRPSFVRRHETVFWADLPRTKLSAARPSFQGALTTLQHIRRQLNAAPLNALHHHRVTYPCLDRDLLVFLFAIDREQLVRPGQRRSLLRRALAGVVPPEILGRKRKAYVARHPLKLLEAALPRITALLESSHALSWEWIDRQALSAALSSAQRGNCKHILPLLRTLRLEVWLQVQVRNHSLRISKETTEALAEKATGLPIAGVATRDANRFSPARD
jgi:asparagine synthase (glutamine-hydrolysing)